jgi:hypothetical protein
MKTMFQRSIAVAISLCISALTMSYALGAKCVLVEANETANVAAPTKKSTRTPTRKVTKKSTRTSTVASRVNNAKQGAAGKYADVNGLNTRHLPWRRSLRSI